MKSFKQIRKELEDVFPYYQATLLEWVSLNDKGLNKKLTAAEGIKLSDLESLTNHLSGVYSALCFVLDKEPKPQNEILLELLKDNPELDRQRDYIKLCFNIRKSVYRS